MFFFETIFNVHYFISDGLLRTETMLFSGSATANFKRSKFCRRRLVVVVVVVVVVILVIVVVNICTKSHNNKNTYSFLSILSRFMADLQYLCERYFSTVPL